MPMVSSQRATHVAVWALALAAGAEERVQRTSTLTHAARCSTAAWPAALECRVIMMPGHLDVARLILGEQTFAPIDPNEPVRREQSRLCGRDAHDQLLPHAPRIRLVNVAMSRSVDLAGNRSASAANAAD